MDFDKKIINECGTARSVDERNRNYKIYKGFISNEMWIGEPDASKEWRDNKELSKNRFIPTESYNIFTNKHQLFLFGRRKATEVNFNYAISLGNKITYVS